jgi:hypothetical protein
MRGTFQAIKIILNPYVKTPEILVTKNGTETVDIQCLPENAR